MWPNSLPYKFLFSVAIKNEIEIHMKKYILHVFKSWVGGGVGLPTAVMSPLLQTPLLPLPPATPHCSTHSLGVRRKPARLSQNREAGGGEREMMMEASFDTEESFDDPSCLAPQPPGSVSPAKRQIKEVKETKTTVSKLLLLHVHPHVPENKFLSLSFYHLLTSRSISETMLVWTIRDLTWIHHIDNRDKCMHSKMSFHSVKHLEMFISGL